MNGCSWCGSSWCSGALSSVPTVVLGWMADFPLLTGSELCDDLSLSPDSRDRDSGLGAHLRGARVPLRMRRKDRWRGGASAGRCCSAHSSSGSFGFTRRGAGMRKRAGSLQVLSGVVRTAHGGRLFQLWTLDVEPHVAASPRHDAPPHSERACGGLNIQRPTSNEDARTLNPDPR